MTANVVDIQARQARPLPANEAAEQALLGAILVRNDVLEDVAGFLKAEHFFFAGHGAIYEAALMLHRRGQSVDAITVTQALAGDEEIKAIGPAYICELQAGVVSVLNAPDYAQVVHDTWLLRELVAIGHETAASAMTPDIETTAADQAANAQQRIADLLESGLPRMSGPRPIGEALDCAMEELAAVAAARGEIVGASTGLHDLDRIIGGLQAPNLVVLAARTGMGKTVLGLNAAHHVALHRGPVVLYSLEMSKSQLVQRMIAGPTGIPTDRQRSGPLRPGEFVTLKEASQNLAGLPLYIDDGRQRTVAAMRAHARAIKRAAGLSLVVVDYLQLMVSGRVESRVQEVSQITRDLKMLAMDVDVPVLALSQLSRKCEDRTDKRPILPDLRDSGSIEQDADQVVFIYRDDYYRRAETHDYATSMDGTAEIIIGKNRHGRTGAVHCRFDGARQRFLDSEEIRQEGMF